ncbi:MAG: hypothetical protein EOP88_18440 [Verrucomicrobiaceae bacterium]|nr:MAG: hypothetical protein EOP88_18440 [Verrucomicrobiaceae bacterium]
MKRNAEVGRNRFLTADYADEEDGRVGADPWDLCSGEGGGFELKWDGYNKHFRELDPMHYYIWSSVTLYDEAIRQKRKAWYVDWLSQREEVTLQDVMHFHRFAGDGNTKSDLIMNRDGGHQTVSITAIDISAASHAMHYYDIERRLRSIYEWGFVAKNDPV